MNDLRTLGARTESLQQFIKYLLVGGLNTLISAAIIFAVQAAGARPVVANLSGYAIGVAISYALNSKYTFRTAVSRYTAIRFLLVLLIAYLANLATMLAVLHVTHAPYIAQLCGIPVYVIVGFLGNRYWAMRERAG
ncbi:GtrA family protein [Paraburkholderia sp. MMS20-SJTR3]|uniref:GtrA family protein n=1 Tax=Paraburkholderia sejongensis TaxID=2886946 RepID=A0ABS8K235_9BURK|nr:GtrA family protein [Paraburkholderia sp. MMS20-SJTR3]MCC8396221.1 GtrA family protein [Paraburkholderia sp. MMS20-SJTR3]